MLKKQILLLSLLSCNYQIILTDWNSDIPIWLHKQHQRGFVFQSHTEPEEQHAQESKYDKPVATMQIQHEFIKKLQQIINEKTEENDELKERVKRQEKEIDSLRYKQSWKFEVIKDGFLGSVAGAIGLIAGAFIMEKG